VLQRCKNAPWDADPESDKRLAVFFDGQKNGDAIPIGTQSDRFDWRVFVDYLPGAFDPVTGNAHGWRQTPRMRMFSAIYFAPSITLRSVER
jgi:hypothetical protein